MLKVCILLKTVPTKIDTIVKEIIKMDCTRECYITYGRFDIVAFLEVQSYSEVKTVSAEINSLDGVRSTETLAEA